MVFDWNGALLNDFPINFIAIQKVFEAFGATPPDKEKFRDEFDGGNIAKIYYENGVPEHVTLQEMNAVYRPIIEANWDKVSLAPLAMMILEQCKRLGIITAVVSGEKREVLEKRLEQFQIQDKFDCVFAEAFDKAPILKMIMENCGVKPQEVLFLDDTAHWIEVAKGLGFRTVAYANGYNSFKKLWAVKPDYLVDSFFDLLEIIDHGGEE